MTRLEWIETEGGTLQDLGALLTEAVLIKRRMPAFNRARRKSNDVCAWRLVIAEGHVRASSPRWKLAIARPDDLFFAQDRDLYGPFASPRQASVTLRAIADAHGVCPALLKLDKASLGKPCFAHQVKRCRGACIGLETVAEHTARLKEALSSLAVIPWPFKGAVAFREGTVLHLLNGWAYLGMAADAVQAQELAVARQNFDHDVYRLLVRRIGAIVVVPLRSTAALPGRLQAGCLPTNDVTASAQRRTVAGIANVLARHPYWHHCRANESPACACLKKAVSAC